MAHTYSQSIVASGAHNPILPKTVQIEDAVCNSAQQEQQAMQLNTVFQGKGPDGALMNYVFDAERSIPGVLRIIRRI